MTDDLAAPNIVKIMQAAYEEAINEANPCDHCYHRHPDQPPDWCEVCGGSGMVPARPDEEECWQRVLNAIEAAGYAIVPRALAVTTDADAVAAARFASLEDTTLLAKET